MLGHHDLNLGAFEEAAGIHTRTRLMEWPTGWNEVLQIGLYQKGPDISEVGSTWLDNLKSMHALRPFQPEEMQALSGGMGFLPTAWPAGEGNAPGPRFSVPWIADTRMILYRRDLLARAAVNEDEAFVSPEALFETLTRLRESGVAYPLAMATGGLSVHNLASFVWGRGGHFRSPDYRKVGLVEPAARQGMHDFFRLHEFIHPNSRLKTYPDADQCYVRGEVAVLFSGQWLLQTVINHTGVPNQVAENTHIAPAPGIPYVGAAHLVIWRHSIHADEAFQLARHVTSPEVLRELFVHSGGFPARLDVLAQPPFSTDERFRMVRDSLKRGRNFRSARMWAGVEMRLNDMADQLWADLFANPDLNLPREIEQRVTMMAARMEKTLLAE